LIFKNLQKLAAVLEKRHFFAKKVGENIFKNHNIGPCLKKLPSWHRNSFNIDSRLEQQQQRVRRLPDVGSARTPSQSESHDHSDFDKSDYDETNNKGGVDYDDFDDDDDDFVPR
jgi:hypothetical protein